MDRVITIFFSHFFIWFFYIPQKKRTPERTKRRLSRTYRQPYHIQPAVSYTTTAGKTARFKGLYGIVRTLTHIDKQETYYKVYTPIFKLLSEEIQTLYNEIFVPIPNSIPYGIQIHTEKFLFRNSKPSLMESKPIQRSFRTHTIKFTSRYLKFCPMASESHTMKFSFLYLRNLLMASTPTHQTHETRAKRTQKAFNYC